MTSYSFRIQFVCLGNICRSPAGENLMRHLLSESPAQDKIFCGSAGTAGYHIGKNPDPRMVKTLKKRHIPVTGTAEKFTKQHFEQYDLILAMDQQNYSDIIRLDPQNLYHHKVRLFSDFCSEEFPKDVPDPYYGGDEGFEKVADMLTNGCLTLLEKIQNKEAITGSRSS